ncbi:hypothetical protein L0663_04280 [Dyadobacter sp. CY107]|uniref:hypothetical protein n=1 Tax=Dyadobacter fanqingshengii TaxID=2906443 RepID=UPI001F1C6F12|nr:hypothetical protein [Dyadobacter fanqingshengii]MCF2502582.1 hypothetical protein [Dyadobacter fanqingshengii]
MFDGAKHMRLSVPGKKLMDNNPRLTFRGSHSIITAEDLTGHFCYAYYKGWTFTAYRDSGDWDRVQASGSYHKFFNKGIHNHNDFSLPDVIKALDNFGTEIGVNPLQEVLQNLEFGVNVTLPFEVTTVLKSLLTYRGVAFQRPIENAHYYQCRTKEFIIKCYDKGREYNLAENILRFEIKVVSMRFFKDKGVNIRNLSDLLNVENYPKLGKILNEYFEAILFRDLELDISRLCPKDKELMIKGQNKDYWVRPESTSISYEAARKRQHREEKKFRMFNIPAWHTLLREAISAKWEDLTNLTDEIMSHIQQSRDRWRSGIAISDMSQIQYGHFRSECITIVDDLSRSQQNCVLHECADPDDEMSHIQTLYVGRFRDNLSLGTTERRRVGSKKTNHLKDTFWLVNNLNRRSRKHRQC